MLDSSLASPSLFGILALTVLPAVCAQTRYAPLASASARSEHILVHDPARNVTIRFGGQTGGTMFNDTFSFDGSAWTTLSPAASPSARARAAAAYDPVRREIVLFGGRGAAGNMLGDTWVWDGTTWTQRAAANPPAPRSAAAMAYDSFRRRLILFGGWTSTFSAVGDTWEWDGTQWRQLPISGAPSPRGGHRMVQDPASGSLFLFGGYEPATATLLADTWTFSALGWLRQPRPGPSARFDHGMVFDSLRGRVVLFGGIDGFSAQTPVYDGQTWEWARPQGWVMRDLTGSPGPRGQAEMIYDPLQRRVVLHGGSEPGGTLGETFALSRGTPASAGAYGVSCASSVGIPRLEVDQYALPWRGDTFPLFLRDGLRSNGQWLLWFGTSRSSYLGAPLPLPLEFFGVPGCQLNTAFDASIGPYSVGGGQQVVVDISLCDCPSLIGRQVFLQAMVLDPAVQRRVPIATTNGIELVIGDG